MPNFGWYYPAGAANDPLAPYNQSECPCQVCGLASDICECPECPECGECGNPACAINQGAVPKTPHGTCIALMEKLGCDDLYSLYRTVYKATDCGPSLGFTLRAMHYNDNGESGPGGTVDEWQYKTLYCDDLRKAPGTTLIAMRAAEYDDVVITDIRISSIVEGVDQTTATIVLSGCNGPVTTADFWEAIDKINDAVSDIWQETHGCEGCAAIFNATIGTEYEGCDGITPVAEDCADCGGNGVLL